MSITSIKQQLKNTERVSVYINGRYAFSLSLDELLNERLKVGDTIDEPRLKTLKKISSEGKLKSQTLNWLMLRPHSERELRNYLRRKKADSDLVDIWAGEFTTKKYLDDLVFSKWWVESRRRSKQRSSRALQAELRAKGINSEIIKEVLEDANETELQALKELIAKKSLLSRYKNDQQKLTEYLIRQGFPYGLIKQSLKADLPFSEDE